MELEPIHDEARGAVCSAHPEVPAAATCVRCGDFLCEACTTDGASVCGPCRARAHGAALPFERSTFDIGAALSHAWKRFEDQWFPLTAAGTAAYFIPMIVQYAFTLGAGALVGTVGVGPSAEAQYAGAALVLVPAILVAFVLQCMFYLAGYRVALDVLECRAPTLDAYFAAMKRAPTALLQMLLLYPGALLAIAPIAGVVFFAYAAIGEDVAAAGALVAALVVVVGMIWTALGLAFVWPEIAYDPEVSAFGSIKRSWVIAKGQRLNVFLMGIVLFAVAIAGFLMCCVGYLPALGFIFLMHATVHLGLRRGLLPAVSR